MACSAAKHWDAVGHFFSSCPWKVLMASPLLPGLGRGDREVRTWEKIGIWTAYRWDTQVLQAFLGTAGEETLAQPKPRCVTLGSLDSLSEAHVRVICVYVKFGQSLGPYGGCALNWKLPQGLVLRGLQRCSPGFTDQGWKATDGSF